jgi:multidrug efflux pump subunit AcrA (membrane-fusion protein)
MRDKIDPFPGSGRWRLDFNQLAALGLLLMLAAGCGGSTDTASENTQERRPPKRVQVVKPKRATVRPSVSQPGAIQAYEETPMFAKIAGYVKKWNVDIGARVHTGQVLAELSVPELVVELGQKEALIQQAAEQIGQARKTALATEAAFKSSQAMIAEAEANQERAVAELNRTKSQYERLARAGKRGVIDRESVAETRLGYEASLAALKQAQARVQTARATRDENKANWDKALADVRVAEAKREVACKNRDYVKAQLEYTHITAPYEGIVTERNINTRDFVQTATAGKDQPLYVVKRTDLMRVFVQVPETDAGWVQKGATARIRVQARPEQEFEGHVKRISWALDQTTRTLRAEIDLPNPGGRLRPGMYAYATLTAELPKVLSLPRSALRTEGEVTRGYQTFCYQVVNGKARRLLVETGVGDSERVQVLKKQVRQAKSGRAPRWVSFTGQEKIVAEGVKDLTDGQPVKIAQKR